MRKVVIRIGFFPDGKTRSYSVDHGPEVSIRISSKDLSSDWTEVDSDIVAMLTKRIGEAEVDVVYTDVQTEESERSNAWGGMPD